jgi:hypothetical protein
MMYSDNNATVGALGWAAGHEGFGCRIMSLVGRAGT